MEIADLPEEVLLFLLNYLDNESMASSSRVCVFWRLAVHTICCRRLCKIAKTDQTAKKGLERWGWTPEKHNTDFCLDICLEQFPWRKMINLVKFQKFEDSGSILCPACAITPDKVFVAQVKSTTCVQVLDRGLFEIPHCLIEFPQKTEVHLYGIENTLVILSCRRSYGSPWLTSSIRLDDFTVSIWNAESFEFVTNIHFLNQVKSTASNYMNSEISDVAIEQNMIALHIYGSGLLGSASPNGNVTLFFSLNTKIPQKETILFLTKVEQPIKEEGFVDCGFICINKNAFVRSGESETNTIIQCFDLDTIKINQPLPWSTHFDSHVGLDLKLEPGISYNLAIFDQSSQRLVIFDIKEKVEIVNLNFDTFSLHLSNWCAGNLFLVKYCANYIEEGDLENLAKLVVVGKKSTVNVLPLNQPFLQHKLETEEDEVEGVMHHIDLFGTVVIRHHTLLCANFEIEE